MASAPSKWAHRPPLDGLRAVAALLVLLFHAGVGQLSGGYVGVDVFFVLSGFLITSILARERARTGRIDLLRFYARRIRRLLPAAALVLVATAIAYRLLPTTTPLDHLRIRPGAFAAALYGSNWWFLAEAQDYFAQDHGASPFLHYWSLSVEEQFYLVWPGLLAGVGWLWTRSAKAAFVAVVGLTAVSLGLSHAVVLEHPMQSYFGTHARAWQPLTGACVALGLLIWPAPHRRFAVPMTALGLLGLIAAALDVVPLSEALHRGELSVLSMVLLLVGLEGAPTGLVARLLSLKPARVLGDWSYAIYLWHWPVVVLLDHEDLLPPDGGVRVAVIVFLTIGLSALSFFVVEDPMRRVSLSARYGRAVLAGVGASLASVAAVALLLPVDDETRELAAELSQQSERAGAGIVGGGPSVVLLGDSHMRQWYPAFKALARERDWSLSMRTHDACPWADLSFLDDRGRLKTCDYAIESAAVVFLSSRSTTRRRIQHGDEVVEVGAPAWLGLIDEGSRRTVDRLLEVAAMVVMIEPIPEMEEEPGRCLSSGRSDCAAPPTKRDHDLAFEGVLRSIASDDERVHSLDLDELLCPEGVCLAEVDGHVTRKDRHHLTSGYAESLAPELGRRIPAMP